MQDGYDVWSWQGVRAEESPSRARQPEQSPSPEISGVIDYRPILTWTVKDVVNMHRRHGIPINPLYSQGFARVGCFPCINAGKNELRRIVQGHPWAVKKCEEWERLVSEASRVHMATFFHVSKSDGVKRRGIHETARWAMTRRGGKMFDLMAYVDRSGE